MSLTPINSSIDTNDIDNTYPVAGVDNDSQGFRDNFTNIKSGLNTASTEISDLLTKSVLKQALETGETLDNDLQGNEVRNVKLRSQYQTIDSLNSATSGTIAIDLSAANYFAIDNVTGDIEFTLLDSTMYTGKFEFDLELTVVSGAPYVITLPTTKPGGTAGNAPDNITYSGLDTVQHATSADKTITLTDAGKYIYRFATSDQGESFVVTDLLRNTPVSVTDTISTTSSTMPVNTMATLTDPLSGALAITLPNGTEGQTKAISQISAGTVTLTVSNAGWTGSTGTISTSGIGQGCTLLYASGRWLCVGNNGASFT